MVIFTSCSSITLNFDGGHNLIDLMLFRKQWAFNLPLWYNWNTEKWYQTAQGQRTKKHFNISCNVIILHTTKTHIHTHSNIAHCSSFKIMKYVALLPTFLWQHLVPEWFKSIESFLLQAPLFCLIKSVQLEQITWPMMTGKIYYLQL